MIRQKITVGSILEINIDNQYYIYSQILDKGGYAFFDFRSKTRLKDYSVLTGVPVLFILGVYNDVVNKGHWLKVGKLEIREDLKQQPMKFIQDALNPDLFDLYDPNTGEIKPSNRQECKGLECAAVWEAEHVESRIRDHYNGIPNDWLEQLRIK